MRDVLVTGTDTGVGKTVIAASLVSALRARGVRALGFKPAETGINANDPSDSELLARASGERVALASPLLQLSEPLAPAVAAERAGTVLNPEDVESRIAQLRKAGYTLVIEGAGGVSFVATSDVLPAWIGTPPADWRTDWLKWHNGPNDQPLELSGFATVDS